MKIKCQKSDLLSSVNIALKAVSPKTSMVILECLVINASADGIKLISNDMELGIETIVQGEIMEQGSVAINAKVFSEIVRKLPDNEVTIETNSNFNTAITCEKSKFNIMGNSTEEFPYLPEIEKRECIVLSQFALKEIIRQTVFSISDNENTKIMTGELFQIEGDTLRVVALDGHRVSIRKIQLNQSYPSMKVIVPGKMLNEISKILSGELSDEVRIYITEKHILFEFSDTIVLSRLIEGNYYPIDQMLTNDCDTIVTINKREFLSSIDRATLLVKESEKKPILIKISDNSLELKINSTIGSMDEEIDITKEGKDIVIGFNPKFLIDALRVIDEEEVSLYMINSKAPCYIKDKEQNYIYMILPVNINTSDVY